MPRTRIVRAGLLALGLVAATAAGEAKASDTCINYQTGDVFYVAYQNSPPGAEYIVDLGSKDQFLNATNTLTFPDVRTGDFASIFSGTAPNLWVALFGIRNPSTRNAILAGNGAKSDAQCSNSSTIGASQQIDTWGSGLAFLANGVGSPTCSPNAATFPGAIAGSYQATLNGSSQGSLAGNVNWNVETRLSNSTGVRTQPAKTQFFESQNDPLTGNCTHDPQGYFQIYTDGHIQYWPDRDGDLLPDVPIGSDPNADKCPGVSSTNNTDADADNRAVPCDCNDTDPTVWAAPGEVLNVVWTSKTTFTWTAPADKGGTAALKYDDFSGTQSAAGVAPTYSCLHSGLAAATDTDATVPVLNGSPLFYLVRASNPCPGTSGKGTVGAGSGSIVRTVPSCP